MEWKRLQRNRDIHVRSKSLSTLCQNIKIQSLLQLKHRKKLKWIIDIHLKLCIAVSKENINTFEILKRQNFYWYNNNVLSIKENFKFNLYICFSCRLIMVLTFTFQINFWVFYFVESILIFLLLKISNCSHRTWSKVIILSIELHWCLCWQLSEYICVCLFTYSLFCSNATMSIFLSQLL